MEESGAKWKFVYHIRLATKREFWVEDKKCNEIMEFLSDAQLLETMVNVGLFYRKLGKEFIINMN